MRRLSTLLEPLLYSLSSALNPTRPETLNSKPEPEQKPRMMGGVPCQPHGRRPETPRRQRPHRPGLEIRSAFRGLGFIGFIGFIGSIGSIGFIGFIGFNYRVYRKGV